MSSNEAGEAGLIRDREAAMDRAEAAVSMAWPHRSGPQFERAMGEATADLERIAEAMTALDMPRAEQSRALRYLGLAYGDLEPSRGPHMLTRSLDCFLEAERLMGQEGDALDRAKLDFNIGNTLRQLGREDRGRLEQAERRLLSARPVFEAQSPQHLTSVDQALQSTRQLLQTLPMLQAVQEDERALEAMGQDLARGSADPRQLLGQLRDLAAKDAAIPSWLAVLDAMVASMPEEAKTGRAFEDFSRQRRALEALISSTEEDVMSDERSDAEMQAQERVLGEMRKHIEDGGSDGLADALIGLVRTRGAREGIDDHRRAALESALRAFSAAMSQGTSRSSPPPDPTSDDLFAKQDMRRPEEIREDIARTQARLEAMKKAAAAILPLTGQTGRSTRIPEAGEILQRLDRALNRLMQESMRPGGVKTSRFHQPMLQLGDVHKDLQSVSSVDELRRIQSDRLYPSLLQTHQTLLEGHAMVVRPCLGRISHTPNPNLVCFVGPKTTRTDVEPILQGLALQLVPPTRGADEALNRWQDMLRSYVVVVDLAHPDPQLRAIAAYQIGWARALGRPMVVLTRDGERLPFDIEIEPTDVSDPDAIEAAILDALFEGPRTTVDRRASRETSGFLQAAYGSSVHTPTKYTLELLASTPDDEDDGVVFDRIRTLLSMTEDRRFDLITPAWPPAYPEPGSTALFHVMPFREGWSVAVRDAAQRGAGRHYRRHDLVRSDHIIRSLYAEIARATHVLVDITGFNDNVMIELGLAHALGKATRIVAQRTVDLDRLHPVLRFWRVWTYDPAQPAQLTDIVAGFLAEESAERT